VTQQPPRRAGMPVRRGWRSRSSRRVAGQFGRGLRAAGEAAHGPPWAGGRRRAVGRPGDAPGRGRLLLGRLTGGPPSLEQELPHRV